MESLTDNEKAFIAAAKRLMRKERSNMFCYVDLCLHGYEAGERTARATLGSLVRKGVVTEPEDGWSALLTDGIRVWSPAHGDQG